MTCKYLLVCIIYVYSRLLLAWVDIRPGMTEAEIIKYINGTPVSLQHKIWHSPTILNKFKFLNRERIRIIEYEESGFQKFLILELDKDGKMKNCFYLSPHNEYKCEYSLHGDFGRRFNSIKIGDSYDEVEGKIGKVRPDEFYCDSGVWYIRYSYKFATQTCSITFFAATGKVAEIQPVYFDYSPVRMIKQGNREIIVIDSH